MVEIIGERLMPVFEYLHIFPKNTFSGSVAQWKVLEVWELTSDEFDCLVNSFDDQRGNMDWNIIAPENSWWRSAKGSNQGVPDEEFIINDLPLIAWRSQGHIEELRDTWEDISVDERAEYKNFEEYCDIWLPKYYNNIIEYIHEELHASTEGNVCALVTDLAKYNNMSIADIFRIYG